MSNFLKRLGSLPIKFSIILSLKYFSINVSPNYICKVSAALKRGFLAEYLSFFSKIIKK